LPRPVEGVYTLDTSHLQRLEAGMETGVVSHTQPSSSNFIDALGAQCFTVAQADQAIAEGVRVLGLVIQNLPSTAPPTSAGPTVTPGTSTLTR
jgi:hypothetical protein